MGTLQALCQRPSLPARTPSSYGEALALHSRDFSFPNDCFQSRVVFNKVPALEIKATGMAGRSQVVGFCPEAKNSKIEQLLSHTHPGNP